MSKYRFIWGRLFFLSSVIWTVVTTPETDSDGPVTAAGSTMVEEIWDAIGNHAPHHETAGLGAVL